MPKGPPHLDPVVEEAMKQLTSLVYFRRRLLPRQAPAILRRILSPLLVRRGIFQVPRPAPTPKRERSLRDRTSRAGAIHAFKHLKHHGYRFDPADVRAWATANGWTPEDAQQLGEYATGVLGGERYHTEPDPFGQHAIHHWRADAERR